MNADSRIPGRDECVVGDLLRRWAGERPDRNFLEFEDGSSWTFADTLDRVEHAAAGLRSLGVQQGSHVLCWMPNAAEAVLAWLATNYLGAVHVPINTGYRGRLLQHAIELSDAKVMVAHASLLPRLQEIETAQVRDVIVVGDVLSPDIGSLQYHGLEILHTPERAQPSRPVEPWDPNFIILTSGTTGPSKAVISTYIQTWCGGAMGMDYFDADDRVLANLPLFHISGAGAVMDRLTKGGTCILCDGFKPSTFWDTVRRFEVSGCCLVGAMTQFLLRQPPSDRDREHTLRNVVTVPWNQDSRAVAERYGLQMHTAFNMTETAVPIRSSANPEVLGTCGRPRPGVEARVVDRNDMAVPQGEVGQLILRASRPWEISQGYYRNPQATAAAWRNGWFHTGDAFKCDAEGNFFFVDRMKDAIRRRGENISSFEVEAEALGHPSVLEAAAIPVPSAESEDEVLLVVTANAGRTIQPRELLRVPRPAHGAFHAAALYPDCRRNAEDSHRQDRKAPPAGRGRNSRHLGSRGPRRDVRGGHVAGLEGD